MDMLLAQPALLASPERRYSVFHVFGSYSPVLPETGFFIVIMPPVQGAFFCLKE